MFVKNTRPFIFTFCLHERMVFTKVVISYKNVYVHITMVSNTMPDFATMIENVNVEYFCHWADHISIINILHEICLLCKTKATPKDIQLRAIAFIKLRTKSCPSSKSDICDVYFLLATGILQEKYFVVYFTWVCWRIYWLEITVISLFGATPPMSGINEIIYYLKKCFWDLVC